MLQKSPFPIERTEGLRNKLKSPSPGPSRPTIDRLHLYIHPVPFRKCPYNVRRVRVQDGLCYKQVNEGTRIAPQDSQSSGGERNMAADFTHTFRIIEQAAKRESIIGGMLGSVHIPEEWNLDVCSSID